MYFSVLTGLLLYVCMFLIFVLFIFLFVVHMPVYSVQNVALSRGMSKTYFVPPSCTGDIVNI